MLEQIGFMLQHAQHYSTPDKSLCSQVNSSFKGMNAHGILIEGSLPMASMDIVNRVLGNRKLKYYSAFIFGSHIWK